MVNINRLIDSKYCCSELERKYNIKLEMNQNCIYIRLIYKNIHYPFITKKMSWEYSVAMSIYDYIKNDANDRYIYEELEERVKEILKERLPLSKRESR